MREFLRKFVSKWQKWRLEVFSRKIDKAWEAVARSDDKHERALVKKAKKAHNQRDEYAEKLSRRKHAKRVERKERFFQLALTYLVVFLALLPRRRSKGVGWDEE